MEIDVVRLVRVRLPLVTPFVTAHGVENERSVTLVNVVISEADGWGEDVAMSTPGYSDETADRSFVELRDRLVPALVGRRGITAERLDDVLGDWSGFAMARCAIETALLDVELRAVGTSLASHLGGTADRIAPGVAIGLHPDTAATLAAVETAIEQGYRRVKLKIEPGRDIDLVAAVRSHFGSDLFLQVDANGAYANRDTAPLGALDEFDLLMIEEPLRRGDLAGHADLRRTLTTPICLDESLRSFADVVAALDRRACDVVNIKPARVGGLLEAKRIHDLCVERGAPVWCGGMLETGVGRAAALALASLPGFTLPPDLSASDRYFTEDITEPFVLEDGAIAVPDGPGIGVVPDPVRLTELDAEVIEITH